MILSSSTLHSNQTFLTTISSTSFKDQTQQIKEKVKKDIWNKILWGLQIVPFVGLANAFVPYCSIPNDPHVLQTNQRTRTEDMAHAISIESPFFVSLLKNKRLLCAWTTALIQRRFNLLLSSTSSYSGIYFVSPLNIWGTWCCGDICRLLMLQFIAIIIKSRGGTKRRYWQ